MLREQHHLTLVSSARSLDDSDLQGSTDELGELVDKLVVVPPGRSVVRWLRVLRGEPLQVVRAYDSAMHSAVLREVAQSKPRALVLSLVRTAPYASGVECPVVLDYCDALSWQFAMRSRREARPRALLWALESALLRRYEGRVARQVDATMIVADADAMHIRGTRRPRVVTLPYDMPEPTLGLASVPAVPPKSGPWIVMSGDMSTTYSADGAEWFVKGPWPTVRAQVPDARFLIIGRAPSERLLTLATQDANIVVTGAVPRVADYLAQADVAVVPLQYGTGVKTRMLEAFAARVPVVATRAADTDGTAEQSRSAIMADTPTEFARAVIDLLVTPGASEDLTKRATAFADESYSTKAITAELLTCIELAQIRTGRRPT